jgi:hypothetical protein
MNQKLLAETKPIDKRKVNLRLRIFYEYNAYRGRKSNGYLRKGFFLSIFRAGRA